MWGNSARPAKIFGVSAHAFFPFMIFALDWSLKTIIIACIGVIFFIVLERFKYTPAVFLRAISMTLSGKVRRRKRTKTFNRLNKGL